MFNNAFNKNATHYRICFDPKTGKQYNKQLSRLEVFLNWFFNPLHTYQNWKFQHDLEKLRKNMPK
jgi:hypothetical protein